MPTTQPTSVTPEGLPILEAGAHRDARSGSCVMEYVSVLAGERFTDRPQCTHPAVAALAWQVNDAVSHDARQALALRAVDLVGAGRDHDGPVRPLVLAAIARAGLALDPQNRFFGRLERRIEAARARADARRAAGQDPGDGAGGRLSTLLHVGPVNHACAHLLVAARAAGLDGSARDGVMLALLDDCLAAVRGRTTSAKEPATAG
ncbi:hypothetical protein [Actinomycetospora termitidis]|uniref:Uncharacterized protein n=1 Tax=Actinomycetospora termitidis TaxID=3053470 RepID=A0ABT7MA87_9PSEU|nr:hypothetical protein [Actinomycetospora sp. Odt1-22]MDL5157376.1 hypothetical protein [Actinomycetospora sp. Odt1-22]